VKNNLSYIISFYKKVVISIIISQKNKNNFMKKIRKSDNELSWKLVWDADTKDVLFLKQVNGEFETVNELFETKNQNDVYDKINELGLKYDPLIQEEEEWI